MDRTPGDLPTRPAPHDAAPVVSRRGLIAVALAACASASSLGGCALPDNLLQSQQPESHIEPYLATVYDSDVPVTTATLMMVGDMLIHQGVWLSGERSDGTYNYDHFFTHLAKDFSESDIAIVNQETVLGGTERGLESFPDFNSPQELGDAEVAAGVDVALGATNHALDHGFDGIRWTLEYWRSHHPEMVTPGIADTPEEAERIWLIERQGMTFAILNYTQFSNHALPAEDWSLRMLRHSDLPGDVSRARELGADFVVACVHWGTEYVYEPDGPQLRWAEELVEAGVDAVLGTHPHVLQPVEIYEAADGRRVPVFWSLGNFVSWQIEKPRMLGGMAKLVFAKRGDECQLVEWSLEPVVTHKATDPSMGVYRLSEYTEDLASRNAIHWAEGCGDFTAAYCRDLAAQILGPEYDTGSCILRGTL